MPDNTGIVIGMTYAKVIDAAFIYRIYNFSIKTFGPGDRTSQTADHIRSELVEVLDDPDDVTEWADVILLAIQGAIRRGHSPQQLIDAAYAKMTKNEGRVWPDWRTLDPSQKIEHDRSFD